MTTGGTNMRKIEINYVIRSFANDYKAKVEQKIFDVKVKLQELAIFVAANNPWTDKNAITDYIGMIITDYPDLLTLEPKDWQVFIRKYNKVQEREPKMLTTEVNYRTKAKGGFYRSMFYKRILACLGYDDARLILGPIHQTMGLKTCVYCNVNPIIAVDGDVMYQMDHFRPQSQYPFLGTCFYNLQPSCGICNGHKGKKPCDFGLYVNVEQHMELNPFLFISKVNNTVGPYPVCEDISLNGKGKRISKESKAHDEMFHIHNMYREYRTDVSEIFSDAYKMNDSMIAANAACFGIPATRKDVLAYILGHLSFDEKDIHNKPLTKLKQDTIKQMQEGGAL